MLAVKNNLENSCQKDIRPFLLFRSYWLKGGLRSKGEKNRGFGIKQTWVSF